MSRPLEEMLCFALYSASRAVTGHYRPMLDALGLTYPQYLVLFALWDEGELPMKTLAERLSLDSGTLSPLLKRLEARGLIERRRDADDERTVNIVLTGEGRALERRAECLTPAIQEAMGLDDEGLTALREAVTALERSVRSAPPAALPPG